MADAILDLGLADQADAGLWTCVATNAYGSQSKQLRVNIACKTPFTACPNLNGDLLLLLKPDLLKTLALRNCIRCILDKQLFLSAQKICVSS